MPGICPCRQMLSGSVRKRHRYSCITGHSYAKLITRFRPLPAAFNYTTDTLVPCLCMNKLSSWLGGNGEVVLSVNTNTAHSLKQPFADRALGIMIQRCVPPWAWVPSQDSQIVLAPFLGINSHPGISSFSSRRYAASRSYSASTSIINGVDKNPVPNRQP